MDFAGDRPATAKANPDRPLPRVIAVLPFADRTGKAEAAARIRASFVTRLAATRYDVLKTELVDARLAARGSVVVAEASRLDPREAGEIVGAEGLVYGEVLQYQRIYAILYSQVTVRARVRLVAAATGVTLWKAEDASRRHGAGIAIAPWGLPMAAATTALNMRDVELGYATDDLTRRMVETIPVPPLIDATILPRITGVRTEGAGRVLRTGDTVTVVMTGDPEGMATFDLAGLRTGLPMQEEPKGTYTGRYTVVPGDLAAKTHVVAYLADHAGRRSEWVDAVAPLAVDAVPPGRPVALQATVAEGQIRLAWRPAPEPDLATYRVYRSLSRSEGFRPAGDTTEATWQDPEPVPYRRAFYRVGAVDQAGNEGDPSEPVEVFLVPPGPTRVGGPIAGEATWYAAASPYVITAEVVIPGGARLTIEPGTVVRSEGPALRIRGRLTAEGKAGAPIVLGAEAPGRWEGLVLEGSGASASSLAECRVFGARVGIVIEGASPGVRACTIEGSELGVRIAGEDTRPSLRDVQVLRNTGAGVLVERGASPRLEDAVIAENGGAGVEIDQAGPTVVRSTIRDNGGAGLMVRDASLRLEANAIHGNRAGQVVATSSGGGGGAPLDVSDTWWNTVEIDRVLAGLSGRLTLGSLLDGPPPGGKPVALSALGSPLPPTIEGPKILLASAGPFLLESELLVGPRARLVIQPGTVIRLGRGARGIVVAGGQLVAQGTAEHRIMFESATASPAPGDFASAVQFLGASGGPSTLAHVEIANAASGIVIAAGAPDLAHLMISRSSQNALVVRGEAAPKITSSLLADNRNGAAVLVLGFARPVLRGNRFVNNGWHIINQSQLPSDARGNSWGEGGPRETDFVGPVEY